MICGFGKIPDEIREKWLVISPTGLIDMMKSPSTYQWNHLIKKKEETAAMRKGTLLHMAVLEPERFDSTYTRVNNAFKAYSAEELKELCKSLAKPVTGTKSVLCDRIREVNPEFWTYDDEMAKIIESGKQVLSESEWLMCETVKMKAAQRRPSGFLLKKAQKEVQGYCQFNDQVIISFRVDAFCEQDGNGVIIDVKTSENINPMKIMYNNAESGRHIQMACYQYCLNKITGLKFDEMSYYMFIESLPPHDICEVLPDTAMIDAGMSETRVLINKFIKCKQTNKWPEAYPNILSTTLSERDWARIRLDEEHL